MNYRTFAEALRALDRCEQMSIYRLDLGGTIARYGSDLAFIDFQGVIHPLAKFVRASDKQATDWQVAYILE